MSLTQEIIQKIQDNRTVKHRLAIEFERSEQTINRWLKKNHSFLSKPVSIRIIMNETGLKRSEIMTNV